MLPLVMNRQQLNSLCRRRQLEQQQPLSLPQQSLRGLFHEQQQPLPLPQQSLRGLLRETGRQCLSLD